MLLVSFADIAVVSCC